MARRSLQALFDLAAEDSSTWQTSGASTAGGDTEDDGDTGLFASATSGESIKPSPLVSSLSDAEAAAAAILAGMPGPSTPANCDSGLLGAADAACVGGSGGNGSSRPGSPLDATTGAPTTAINGSHPNVQDNLSSLVPLRHLLMSERGRRLTALEAKAIILRVAEDLAALHAANAVHRRVSIESISLTTCIANGVAVAILPPGRSAAVLGSNRCYWALKDPVFDAVHAPPEVACCPVDRPVAFTPAGDMWGLGIVLFSLLSAGRVPFSAPSCLCTVGGGGGQDGDDGGGSSSMSISSAMTSTVDALQRQLHSHINCQIDVMNQLSAAQAAGATGTTEEDLMEMMAIGFDAHAKKLLLGLLHADPAQRFCAEDVLKHPWVAEAVPCVPKMPPSSLPFVQKTAREASPPMSDVLRRTEQLGFTPQSNNPHHLPVATATAAPVTAPGECPYPIIGHVAQPLEVMIGGRKVTISALHAVYNVPGYGAMMSAAPSGVADPDEVAAAAAAAQANGHLSPEALAEHLLSRGGRTG
jgi:hypothetical protein